MKLYSTLITLFLGSLLNAQITDWNCYSATEVVTDIYIDGQTQWIASYGGLIKLENGTQTIYTKCNSGLPTNEVNAIAQTTDGKMWFATEQGVCSYDGNSWTVFNSTNSSLTGDRIKSITTDGNTVWIGTWANGAAKYNGINWTTYTTSNSNIAEGKIEEVIVQGNAVWFAVDGSGMNRFENGNWDLYGFFDGVCEDIRAVGIDQNGTLWAASGNVSCSGNNLVYFDGSQWLDNEPPYIYAMKDMVIDDQNNFWFSTGNGDVLHYDGNTWMEYDNSNTLEIPAVQFNTIALDENGDVWVGTGDRCFVYDHTNWTEQAVGNSILSTNYVNCVAANDNNDVWVGTQTGLYQIIDGNWTEFNIDNSDLHANWIDDVEFNTNGDVWAMNTEAISIYNGSSWTSLPNIPISYYRDLEIGSDGTVWIGSSLEGLARYQNGSWETYNSSNSELNSNKVYEIEIDANGHAWLCTFYGIMEFDGTTWTDHSSNIPGNIPDDVAFEQDGDVWVATWQGLSYYNGTEWTTYTSTDLPDIPVEDVNTITIDENGDKWFGSIYGVIHFDDNDWTLYDESNSVLPENNIKNIDHDNNGVIWMATEGGGLIGAAYEVLAGIKQESSFDYLNVYPNPTNNIVNLQLENFSDLSQPQIKLYNMTGQLVHTQSVLSANSVIDISHLAIGPYQLTVQSNEINLSQLIMKN